MERLVEGTIKVNNRNVKWYALNYYFDQNHQLTIFYFNRLAQFMMFYGTSKEIAVSSVERDHALLYRYIGRIYEGINTNHHHTVNILRDQCSDLIISKKNSSYILNFDSYSDSNYFNLLNLSRGDYVYVDNALSFLLDFERQVDMGNAKTM